MDFKTLISVEGLSKFLHEPNWIIVDCRFSLDDPDQGYLDYQESHIPGAIYTHLDNELCGDIISGQTGRHPLPEIDVISTTFGSWGIDKYSQVVAYDDEGGMFAGRFWWLLQWLGHERVAVLDGGLQAWIDGGHDVTNVVPNIKPKTFNPSPRKDMITTVDALLSHMGDPSYLLVDSRAPERYWGTFEPIDPVAGRIPGAVNYYWLNNLDPRGFFVTKDILRGRFETLFQGIPTNNVTFYCGSGVTAAHNVLATAHSGLGMSRIYPGSWSHWILDPERPIMKGK